MEIGYCLVNNNFTMNYQRHLIINTPYNTFDAMNVLGNASLLSKTNVRSNSRERVVNKRDRKFRDRVELAVDQMIQLGLLEDSTREGNINILMKFLQSKLIDLNDIILSDKYVTINHTRITNAGYIMYQTSIAPPQQSNL